jgi:hypothetical protein
MAHLSAAFPYLFVKSTIFQAVCRLTCFFIIILKTVDGVYLKFIFALLIFQITVYPFQFTVMLLKLLQESPAFFLLFRLLLRLILFPVITGKHFVKLSQIFTRRCQAVYFFQIAFFPGKPLIENVFLPGLKFRHQHPLTVCNYLVHLGKSPLDKKIFYFIFYSKMTTDRLIFSQKLQPGICLQHPPSAGTVPFSYRQIIGCDCRFLSILH